MNLGKEIFELELKDIMPNRFQPREVFDDSALEELSQSIKEHGVIQPIVVRKVGDKYEIIAGERRYRASLLAGKETIPAIVSPMDDKEAAKVALIENLQRKDLSAIEEAKTYQTILKLDSMTQEELAQNLGKSQSAIANKLRLLNLDDEVQTALLNGEISERHARSLLNLESKEAQKAMLKKIIENRLTVRQLDEEIAAGNIGGETTPGGTNNTNNIMTNNQDMIGVTPDAASAINGGIMNTSYNSGADNIIGNIAPNENLNNNIGENIIGAASTIPTQPIGINSNFGQNSIGISNVGQNSGGTSDFNNVIGAPAQNATITNETPVQPPIFDNIIGTNIENNIPTPENQEAGTGNSAPAQSISFETPISPSSPISGLPENNIDKATAEQPNNFDAQIGPVQDINEPVASEKIPRPPIFNSTINPNLNNEQPKEELNSSIIGEASSISAGPSIETNIQPPVMPATPLEDATKIIPSEQPTTPQAETPEPAGMPVIDEPSATLTETQPEPPVQPTPTPVPIGVAESAPMNVFNDIKMEQMKNEQTPAQTEPDKVIEYDMRFAINNFRQAVQNTEKFGFKVEVAEVDLESSHQIIINILKNKDEK